jgi:hypothetical protein
LLRPVVPPQPVAFTSVAVLSSSDRVPATS